MIEAMGRLSATGKRRALAIVVVFSLATVAASSLSANAEPGSALGPLAAHALPVGQRLRFEARVLERLRAGSYTYLLLERAGGQRNWAVTLASSAGAQPRTQSVSVVAVGYASHFHSKRLARDFDELYFAVVRPA
jgi:hypothetical protein